MGYSIMDSGWSIIERRNGIGNREFRINRDWRNETKDIGNQIGNGDKDTKNRGLKIYDRVRINMGKENMG
jgi:hypothetical protein